MIGKDGMVPHSRKLVLSSILVFGVLLLIRVITIAPGLVDAGAAFCSYPLVVMQYVVVKPWHRWHERKLSLQELADAVVSYRQQVSSLMAENIALKTSLLHVGQMDEVLHFSKRYQSDTLVVGQVILKQFTDTSHFFLLDVGTKRGICKDMIAVRDNYLIGRVSEVYPYYCRVTLITDKTSKVPVICVNTKTQGILEGTSSRREGTMNFVSHLLPLAVDDLVISSGDGLIYPKGFAVGTIKDFTLNSMGVTYQVTVSIQPQWGDISYCCLIQKGAEYEGLPEDTP
jgi:rod shape-determining protein MreC